MRHLKDMQADSIFGLCFSAEKRMRCPHHGNERCDLPRPRGQMNDNAAEKFLLEFGRGNMWDRHAKHNQCDVEQRGKLQVADQHIRRARDICRAGEPAVCRHRCRLT